MGVQPVLQFSSGPVEYHVVRSRRRSVAVSVTEEGDIRVHAPNRATLDEIHQVAQGFRAWIERRRAEVLVRRSRLAARRFVEGDQIPFCGGQLTLRVSEVDSDPAAAELRDGELHVQLSEGAPAADRSALARHAVLAWCLLQAQEQVHQRHREFAPQVGTSAVRIVLKEMKTRWGSCGPNRRMSLNWRLILAPPHVLDYVIVHELCHVFEPNHSRAFWRRVEAVLPAARTSRKWLRRHGEDLVL